MEEIENGKLNWKIYLLFAVVATVVAFFAFESSPFYPLEDWGDPNCFFTVGRAMLDGKVTYRDIYEQKGFYVYFIHALCALVSDSSFIGVFFLEIGLLFLNGFFAWKILCVYDVGSVFARAFAVVVFMLSVGFSFAASTGDSVEEFVSPFFLWMVYLTVKHIKRETWFTKTEYVLIGVLAGYVFWSKFSCVAFFVGWFAFFFVANIRRKTAVEIGKCVGFVVCGFALASLPVLIYFAVNGAIDDCLRVYLYDNIFVYTGERSLWRSLWYPIKNIYRTLFRNLFYGVFVVFGVVWFCWKKKGQERLFAAICPAVTALLLFIGGRGYRYYGLPLYVFAPFGYVGLFELCSKGFVRMNVWVKRLTPVVVSAVAVVLCVSCFFVNGNQHYIFRDREDTAQYTFARYVKEHGGKDATILNYGFLDRGFYLAHGETPSFKYFATLNIPLEDMEEEMQRYLDEGIPEFVVTVIEYKGKDRELKSDNYEEVLRITQPYRGRKATYVLHQRK